MAGEELVAERVAEALSGLGVAAAAQGRVVTPGPGTPEIVVRHVDFRRPRPAVWIAHADIRLSLNPERAEPRIDDCATGWAEPRERAAEVAAHAWTRVSGVGR